ncbi:hypothetical protein BV898_17528 [Hypsibius exemplaris]|uniref:Uncharacterized protein n=1 Tax=Hypsibius exemplaris TaxID=2072580 RepID=A0A9X6NNT7_HYPEX|nr:hypothetical protein BV898_17528 [Hypsibius exemplaris]
MVENEAMEVASNNGSALESGPSASLMDVAPPSSTKQSSFANLYTCMSSFYDRSTTPEAAAGLPVALRDLDELKSLRKERSMTRLQRVQRLHAVHKLSEIAENVFVRTGTMLFLPALELYRDTINRFLQRVQNPDRLLIQISRCLLL